MSVVGIDPSLTRTAVVILHDDGSCTLRQKATTGRAGASIRDRLLRLGDIAQWTYDVVNDEVDGKPDAWAIEGPSLGTKSMTSGHDRSGLWWLMLDNLAGAFGNPIVVPPACRAKYATGKGNAGKDEVLAAVVRRYDWAPVENNDQADAFVIAMIAARVNGTPLDDPMPKAHLDALAKVTLP